MDKILSALCSFSRFILGESQNEVKKKTTLRTFGHFDDVADVFHAYRIIWR